MKRLVPAIVCSILSSIALAAVNPQLGFSELQQNQAQPHITINSADRTISQALAGQITINFITDTNLSLLSSQWPYGTILFTDTGPVLTSARDVIYPNVDSQTGGISRMQFIVQNDTARTLTIKRSGQTGVAIAAGESALVRHNGTDIEEVAAGGGGGGTVDLTSDVTGVLPFANGGTNLSSASDDTVMVSSGSAWQAKSIPNCVDTGGNHVNYTTSTNTWSCGTSSSGGGGGGSADDITYDNTTSEMSATDVQEAVDELDARADAASSQLDYLYLNQLYSNGSIPGSNTVSNSSLETEFSTTHTVNANTVTARAVLRIRLFGTYSTDASVAPTIRIQVKMGGNTILDTTAVTTVVGIDDRGWSVEGQCIFFSAGESANADAQGLAQFATALTTGLSVNMVNTDEIGVDTTQDTDFTVSAQWNNADTDNTITLRQFVLELTHRNPLE